MSQITNFPITVYGNKEKFSDTMTRGRCRVFYKGHNRNGTYITNEFAKKLIASAPYTPVKGIYDVDDYTDHGKERTEGRIYGIIPAEPNFAWEPHEDENGKIRDYACFDVLYYTALYGEAGEIAGKGQSMELYRNTLKGAWQHIEGKKAYVFTDGCFLGLQVLGDDVEPCFEGAGFYTQEESILAILEKYEKRPDLFQSPEQGGNIMNITFKLSDAQKHDILFGLLNPNFNEEGGWEIECVPCDIYDDYALVVNYADGSYERVYYTKNDAEDKIEITGRERCYIVDVNTEEKEALTSLRGEGTFTQAVEARDAQAAMVEEQATKISSLQERVTTAEEAVSNLTTENQNYSIKVGELEENISTLTTERDDAQTNFANVSAQLDEVNNVLNTEREAAAALRTQVDTLISDYAALETERNELATFKKNVIDNEKKLVIEAYNETLSAEVLETYTLDMDKYTAEELDMRLTYECKKINPTIFSKNPVNPQPNYLPKEEPVGRGINDILAHYEKK